MKAPTTMKAALAALLLLMGSAHALAEWPDHPV